MPKTSKAKELREQAKALGLRGWEDMGLSELREAVREAEKAERGSAKSTRAKKTSSTKRKVKKTAATKAEKPVEAASEKPAKSKKAKPAKAEAAQPTPAKRVKVKAADIKEKNPYRPGSNLYEIAPLLMKGGTRKDLAQSLSEKISLHPYANDPESISLGDYDKRIVLASANLRDEFGFTIVRDGRGLKGFIQAIPSGHSTNGGRAKSKTKAKASK